MSDEIKQQSLLEFSVAGGEDLLEFLERNQGTVLSCTDPRLSEEQAGMVAETGGWLWVCPECFDYSSPNRGCGCPPQTWPEEVRKMFRI